jgi:ethanolamine utilization protein EutP (predicted NTPase)
MLLAEEEVVHKVALHHFKTEQMAVQVVVAQVTALVRAVLQHQGRAMMEVVAKADMAEAVVALVRQALLALAVTD